MNRQFILLLVILSSQLLFSGCLFDSNKKDTEKKGPESLTKNIGEKFNTENFIDTSGKPVKLDFTKSDITIIDFWFNDCPPCNAEMAQFKELLKGKENKITIISISVSSYSTWKKLFIDKAPRYSFLTTEVPNWLHLNLQSNDDPRLKNSISADRLAELQTKLNVSFFPAYFIIGKDGIIKARPMSAVDYIKNKL